MVRLLPLVILQRILLRYARKYEEPRLPLRGSATTVAPLKKGSLRDNLLWIA